MFELSKFLLPLAFLDLSSPTSAFAHSFSSSLSGFRTHVALSFHQCASLLFRERSLSSPLRSTYPFIDLASSDGCLCAPPEVSVSLSVRGLLV